MKTQSSPHSPKKQTSSPNPTSTFTRKNNAKTAVESNKSSTKKKDIRAEKFKFNRKAQGEGDNKYSDFRS